jgi:hypothetical protein
MKYGVIHGEKATNSLRNMWEGSVDRIKPLEKRSGFWRKVSSLEPRMP